MEQTTKTTAINYGIYLGGIISLITIIVYGVDLDLFINPWLGIVLFILVIAFGAI